MYVYDIYSYQISYAKLKFLINYQHQVENNLQNIR